MSSIAHIEGKGNSPVDPETKVPALSSRPVNAMLVNRQPWSELKISS